MISIRRKLVLVEVSLRSTLVNYVDVTPWMVSARVAVWYSRTSFVPVNRMSSVGGRL